MTLGDNTEFNLTIATLRLQAAYRELTLTRELVALQRERIIELENALSIAKEPKPSRMGHTIVGESCLACGRPVRHGKL